jgi:hypothetical protein
MYGQTWTKEELAWLRDNYQTAIAKKLKERFPHHSLAEIRKAACRYGYSKRRRKLYEFFGLRHTHKNGLTDKEMAKELGISRSTVIRWRKKQNLPANFPFGKMPERSDEIRREKLRLAAEKRLRVKGSFAPGKIQP